MDELHRGSDLEVQGDARRRPSAAIGTPVLGNTEHIYHLQNNKGQKWLSLIVRSRSRSARFLPQFLEGDAISGRVELDLDKPKTIRAVAISVNASTSAVGQEEIRFLDITNDLWTLPKANTGFLRRRSGVKVNGRHWWSFSLVLPHTITLPSKDPQSPRPITFDLPPTYTERASPVFVDYRLVVTIKRGGLKVDQLLSTTFGYQPMSSPEPPSEIRQLSYREGCAIIGPEGDPDGWKVLAPVHVYGKLFDVREVEVTCTLAVATPLCFALGTPVHLMLTISSTDSQALDLLSKPSAIHLYLVKSVAVGSDAIIEDAPRRSSSFFQEDVGRAIFWPSKEGAPETGARILEGELHVNKNLKPSFTFPRLTIRYTLDLRQLKSPGFVVATSCSGGVLLSEKARIVTARTPGILPHSYAPPGCTQLQETDYNRAVGFLENGNQRFVRLHKIG